MNIMNEFSISLKKLLGDRRESAERQKSDQRGVCKENPMEIHDKTVWLEKRFNESAFCQHDAGFLFD